MNLADAIRRASQAPTPLATPLTTALAWDEQPFPETRASEPIGVPANFVPQSNQTEEETMSNEPAHDLTEAPAQAGTAVRLEMFLTPEQLSSLFRAVAANQHTLMTAREAASYLRVTASALEGMATEGEIPGFLVDGRWRFSKQAIDEWLVQQTHVKEAA
ncbi:MAG: helix-turn-helix domain-containing protein [Methanoregulaceae archaeon]|jgi:excisionase family DNA binding protein|nr:helix-turn-helix domain-containing protein [Methanoregulaceae archaeon]